MALLVLALVSCFVVGATVLAEVGIPSALAVLIAIPVSYGVGYALSRLLRGVGAL